MKEKYYLNGKEVPTIPGPHDCVVKDIKLDDGNLVFIFEDDMKLFVRSKTNRFLHKAGVFKEIDLIKKQKDLYDLTKGNLEYLYHNVGY